MGGFMRRVLLAFDRGDLTKVLSATTSRPTAVC